MKTLADIAAIIAEVAFPDRTFVVEPKGDGFLLQLRYVEADVYTAEMDEQHSRKWYLSAHATESEIVQTALKCVITSFEHIAREHFTYRGARVFHPHHHIDDLLRLADAPEDHRQPEFPVLHVHMTV